MGTVIGITMSRMIDLRLFEEVTWGVLYYYSLLLLFIYYYYLLVFIQKKKIKKFIYIFLYL